MANLPTLRFATAACLAALCFVSASYLRKAPHANQQDAVKPPDTTEQTLDNFRSRCAAPGVLQCVDFDGESWFQKDVYLFRSGDGVYRGTRDSSTKVSGASSLRFEFPGRTGASGAGYWSIGFGKEFAENSKFFVQYHMRLNDVMVNTDWNGLVQSSWKQSIFHSKGTTCASIELTAARYGWSGAHGFPIMYTDCGDRTVSTNNGDPPFKLEQGDYNCWYRQYNAKSCMFYPANEWLTFYFSVSIGDWGKPNSNIQAWVAREGQPLKKWVDMPGFILKKDSDSSSYNWITLLPYMTAKNAKVDHPTGYMWFDELIVSSQPIPAPFGPTP